MSRSGPIRSRPPAAIATLNPEVAAGYEGLVRVGPVDRLDRWADNTVEARLRGNPVADRVFYAASALGDHGIIWLILAVVRGLRSPGAWRATVRAAAAIGVESIVVNGPVKWVFRRERPAPRDLTPHPLRHPRTSSFPSGHATSAFCAAALLSDGDPALRPFYYALAGVVAWSRVHVKLHHASDVIGGMAIGVLLGQAFKRLVPLPPAAGADSWATPRQHAATHVGRESRPSPPG